MAIVISVAAVLLNIAGFFLLRRYVRLRTEADKLLAGYRDEVDNMIAEIDAATDRDSRLVEQRIKTLRQVLEEANRRIGTYVRELNRSRQGEAMYASLGRGIRSALDHRSEGGEDEFSGQPLLFGEDAPPRPQEIPRAGSPESASPHEETVPSDSSADTPPDSSADVPSEIPDALPISLLSSKSRLKQRIAGLVAEGLSAGEIASKLDIGIAEVELAINLLDRDSFPRDRQH
jgi:hypothetical protein